MVFKNLKNNRYTKKYAKELKKAQKQHLSRKQKGSNGFEKQKLKVAKIHEKITTHEWITYIRYPTN